MSNDSNSVPNPGSHGMQDTPPHSACLFPESSHWMQQVDAEAQEKNRNWQVHAHIWEPGAAVCADDLGTSITSLAPHEAERILLLALILYGETLLSTALSNK